MKLKVFAVFDIKSNLFSSPFFMGQTGEALRAFRDLANNKETTVGRHPEDFVLKSLGWFDNESGIFGSEGQVSLGVASEFVALGNVVPLGMKGA